MSETLEVVPLGGLGEFGMHMMAFRCNGTIIVVDAGVMFPDEELLGVDIIVPDITYLLEKKSEVKAIFLTHGHEDHIGALTMQGGTVDTGTKGINFSQGTFASGTFTSTGFVNVAGGTLLLGLNTATGTSAVGTTNAYFNFAGGTVKATAVSVGASFTAAVESAASPVESAAAAARRRSEIWRA